MSSPEREAMRELGEMAPVDMAGATVDTICAIAGASAARGALGTIYLAIATYADVPIVVMDWDLAPMHRALPTYLHDVYAHLAELQKIVRLVTSPEDMVVWSEASGLGNAVLLEAQKSAYEVRPIPEGVTKMTLEERATPALMYLHTGRVKLDRRAFEKTVTFRGASGNFLRRQIADYDRAQTADAAELLSALCAGILTAFGHR